MIAGRKFGETIHDSEYWEASQTQEQLADQVDSEQASLRQNELETAEVGVCSG